MKKLFSAKRLQMRSKLFHVVICTCASIMSVLVFSGCSGRADDPYEMPSDSSSVESIVVNSSEENSDSSEQSVDSFEQSTASSDTSPGESIGSDPESDSEWGPYEPYREIRVDDEFLKTVEKDILCVCVNLYFDDEALRAEYKEKYPNIVDNPSHWCDFLREKKGSSIIEFLSDYNFGYDDLGVIELLGDVYGDLEKETISLMLKDPRVAEIIYRTGGGPLDDL